MKTCHGCKHLRSPVRVDECLYYGCDKFGRHVGRIHPVTACCYGPDPINKDCYEVADGISDGQSKD